MGQEMWKALVGSHFKNACRHGVKEVVERYQWEPICRHRSMSLAKQWGGPCSQLGAGSALADLALVAVAADICTNPVRALTSPHVARRSSGRVCRLTVVRAGLGPPDAARRVRLTACAFSPDWGQHLQDRTPAGCEERPSHPSLACSQAISYLIMHVLPPTAVLRSSNPHSRRARPI